MERFPNHVLAMERTNLREGKRGTYFRGSELIAIPFRPEQRHLTIGVLYENHLRDHPDIVPPRDPVFLFRWMMTKKRWLRVLKQQRRLLKAKRTVAVLKKNLLQK